MDLPVFDRNSISGWCSPISVDKYFCTSSSRVSWGGGVTQLVLKNNNPFYFNLSPVLKGIGCSSFETYLANPDNCGIL